MNSIERSKHLMKAGLLVEKLLGQKRFSETPIDKLEDKMRDKILSDSPPVEDGTAKLKLQVRNGIESVIAEFTEEKFVVEGKALKESLRFLVHLGIAIGSAETQELESLAEEDPAEDFTEVVETKKSKASATPAVLVSEDNDLEQGVSDLLNEEEPDVEYDALQDSVPEDSDDNLSDSLDDMVQSLFGADDLD